MKKVKIVIKVPMHSGKGGSKAMQIAVAMEGVSSVSIRKESDELEVIGEGVDSVSLALSPRKKFCFADIASVQEVMPPEPDDPCPSPPPFSYFSPPNFSLGPSDFQYWAP